MTKENILITIHRASSRTSVLLNPLFCCLVTVHKTCVTVSHIKKSKSTENKEVEKTSQRFLDTFHLHVCTPKQSFFLIPKIS